MESDEEVFLECPAIFVAMEDIAATPEPAALTFNLDLRLVDLVAVVMMVVGGVSGGGEGGGGSGGMLSSSWSLSLSLSSPSLSAFFEMSPVNESAGGADFCLLRWLRLDPGLLLVVEDEIVEVEVD